MSADPSVVQPLPQRLPEFASRSPRLKAGLLMAETARSMKIVRFLDSLSTASLRRRVPPRADDTLVSVVVPMFNAISWIDLCLKGLLAQTHHNLEVFCVDDASTDGTFAHVVEQFGGDARVCVIRLGGNVGPYQIKNWVIRVLARGPLVALQDADDVSHPMRIAMQRRWLERTGVRICGIALHQFFPPEIVPPCGTERYVEVDGTRHNIAFYEPVDRVHQPVALETFLTSRRPSLGMKPRKSVAFYAAELFERRHFLELGGFDGRTRMGADRDFNWRTLRFHAIGNVPCVLCSRRFHADSITQRPETSLTSPARLRYYAERDALHEEVRLALAVGDVTRARTLCTSDFFHGDVRVDEVHCSGFDVDVRSGFHG